MSVPLVRAKINQVGLLIEVSIDGGPWHAVQLMKFKERRSVSVMQYSTCVDPAKDREEYFADLDARGVVYKRVRDEE
jgi:hypothetical protein